MLLAGNTYGTLFSVVQLPADIIPIQYLVYCGWLIIELSFIFRFVVETRGRTLEETAALFDGEERPQDLVQLGGEAATQTMTRANAARLGLSIKDKEKAPTDFLEMRENIDMTGSRGTSSLNLTDMGLETDSTERRMFIASSPY